MSSRIAYASIISSTILKVIQKAGYWVLKTYIIKKTPNVRNLKFDLYCKYNKYISNFNFVFQVILLHKI